MNRQQQDDLKLLKKAGRKVARSLILTYIGLCLLKGGSCFVLTQPLFTLPENFLLVYLISMMIELAAWMAEFFFLSTGEKGSRAVYWILTACEFAFGFWVFAQMFSHPDAFLVYLVWFAFILAQCLFLCWFGGWLRHSWWASIFFDHVLVLDEEDRKHEERLARSRTSVPQISSQVSRQPQQTFTPVHQAAPSIHDNEAQPDFTSGPAPAPTVHLKPEAQPDLQMDPQLAARQKAQKEREEKRRISAAYPRMAIRLAIVVYGELILFPLIVHLFSNFFVSMDNSSSFAQSLMFTVCILSAVVWTIPIFFLYLKQPGVRKSLLAGLLLQLCVIAFEAFSLWGYSQNPDVQYATKVFIYFGALELVRYILLFIGAMPAFRLPEIREDHRRDAQDPDELEKQIEEDELLDDQDFDEDYDD